jgi:hypothetical protein
MQNLKINKDVVIKFALLPKKLDDGTIAFLRKYKEINISIDGQKWTILSSIDSDEQSRTINNKKYYVTRGK